MILWNDIEDVKSKSATMTAHFKRIKTMAIAYRSLGSTYYDNQELLEVLNSSIRFMYNKYYNETITSRPNNWWDWEIGSPRELSEITILLYKELGEFRNNLVATLEYFVPDPKTRLNGVVETGANRVDKALIVTLYALSGENPEKIASASDALLQVFPYVTKGDGFYKDGSFVQHGDIAYTGSYGLVLINSLANALLLIQQTEHAVTDKEYFNMYNWIRDSYAPFISKGGNIIDNVRGRAISRESEQGDIRGKLLISSLLKISQIAPEDDKNYIESMCKTWVQEGVDLSDNYFTKMNNNYIGAMKNIIVDNSVESVESENYYK